MPKTHKLIESRTWLDPADAAYLDNMAGEGCFRTRSALIRSLLRAIIEDDRRAHRGKVA